MSIIDPRTGNPMTSASPGSLYAGASADGLLGSLVRAVQEPDAGA